MYVEPINTLLENFDTFGINIHSLPNAIGMWENEQACFLWAALNAPKGDFLEIGAFCGGSAVLLCLVQNYLNLDNTVISVDIDFNEMFDFNVYNRGKFVNHKKIESDSSFVSKYLVNPISLAFIDGYHSFSQVLKDFKQVKPFLTPDAYILFHDVSPYIYDEEYRRKILNEMDYNQLESDSSENFRLDEAVSYICQEYGYNIIKPPVHTDESHFEETGLNEWVRGTTSPFNSLVIIQ